MILLVGLGNPGKQYANTWHNLGFMVADVLTSSFSLQKKFHSLVGEITINDKKIIVAKPQTFMNKSGEAVGALARFYKIKPKDIFVIHDDIDIALYKLKVSTNSSSAGHKGVQSIIDHLQSKAFTRFRMGMKNESAKQIPTDKYVTQRIGFLQRKKVKKFVETTAQEIKNHLTACL